MPVYSYVALDQSGRERRGEIEAAGRRDLAEQLRRQSFYVVEANLASTVTRRQGLVPARLRALGRALSPRRLMPIRDSDMVFLFRQLALMTGSGHTVIQSLDIASQVVRKRALGEALQRMARTIPGGVSLAQSMQAEKKIFSPLMVALVQSGEASGQLEAVMEQIAENVQRRIDLRNQLINAVTYPAIVILIAIGVVWFMLANVIPKFAAFFAQRGKSLPVLTQYLVDISDVVVTYGPTVLTVSGLVTFGLLAGYTTHRGKSLIDHGLLYVPVVGTTLITSASAQFGINFAALLRSGFTAMEGLRVIADVVQNAYFRERFLVTADQVLRGSSLSAALNQRHIPALVRHMAAVGERSGELDTAMEEVGRFFRTEMDTRVKTMVALTGPILTLLIGGVVGLVYIAMMLAVFSASTNF